MIARTAASSRASARWTRSASLLPRLYGACCGPRARRMMASPSSITERLITETLELQRHWVGCGNLEQVPGKNLSRQNRIFGALPRRGQHDLNAVLGRGEP